MSKADLRKLHLRLRSQMSPQDIESGSEAICLKVLEFLLAKPEIMHIHLFLPIVNRNEVNTFPLYKKLQYLGRKLYTSYLSNEILKTVFLPTDVELIEDKWGIPVPKEPIFSNSDEIQLVLVPLLVFDQFGHRIGYGKGYYDGFLSGLSKNVLKIGLCFFPPVESVSPEAHDIPLDACITPGSSYNFSPGLVL